MRAKTMGAAPADCAVVEDTPTGVTRGIAAGMRVFAYAGRPAHGPRARGLARRHRLRGAWASLPALLEAA
jgi:beta-phosphoglucomutase-like phosphatase (HAD superfamily)